LDTAYVANYTGLQLEWLQEECFNLETNYIKFAMYHNPIFCPCNAQSEDFFTIDSTSSGLLYWVPVFDNFSFFTIFENHVHTYKRTFPIKSQMVSSEGVVYLGDGAWGVNPNPCADPTDANNIYAAYGSFNNIWVLNVVPQNNQILYVALGKNGEVLPNSTFARNYSSFV